jgi:NitT/TauT family transport system ATP-binding protein
MIALRGVTKRFPGGTQALRDLTFSVAPGEFASLLGPSGCGKSTALRIAAGLLAPDGGTITRDTDEIGFVFQDPTLMPWADALTNARLPLDLRHTPRAEANDRAATALKRVGLGGFERAYPRELSGGMKMRVSLARALAAQPKLLLLDPSPRWTRSPATRWATTCCVCGARMASPSCSSPTASANPAFFPAGYW